MIIIMIDAFNYWVIAIYVGKMYTSMEDKYIFRFSLFDEKAGLRETAGESVRKTSKTVAIAERGTTCSVVEP